ESLRHRFSWRRRGSGRRVSAAEARRRSMMADPVDAAVSAAEGTLRVVGTVGHGDAVAAARPAAARSTRTGGVDAAVRTAIGAGVTRAGVPAIAVVEAVHLKAEGERPRREVERHGRL